MAIDVDFLVEDLIESAKDRSFAPISQSTFQDADILRIGNEEMLRVVANIIKEREDFFQSRQTTTLVPGKDHYLIPKNASGNALKALFWVDASGNKSLLTRRDVDRIGEYSTESGTSESFYFESDEVVLMNPASSASETLLFIYSRRPNRLLLTENCAKITALSSVGGTTTFTVDTDLTASLTTASYVDFLRATSPFTLWSETVAITAITSTTIAVATADIYDVDGVTVEPGVTDYICPSGYANIPMLPIEFHAVLAQRIACRMLGSLGDLNKLNAARAELKEIESAALAIIKNRAESSPERPSRKRGLINTFRA
jgi:hypothetical protein